MTDKDDNQPTFTIEQFLAIQAAGGHIATQEQLNDVRKELDAKITQTHTQLDAKIAQTHTQLDAKIDSIRNWLIGSLFTMVLMLIGGFGYLINLIDSLPKG